MILQTYHALVRQSVLRSSCPLATVLQFVPLVCPGLKLEYLLSVQPMLHMTVVEHYPGVVPLAVRSYIHLRLVGHMHGIVGASLLPFFELFGEVRLVYELIFRTGDVRHRILRTLHHMIQHAAVAALRQFPVP